MNTLTSFWNGLSLARQFALACFIILLIGMASVSAWVSHKIENAVVHSSSVSAALYMESFITPLIQELDYSHELSEQTEQELDKLIANTPLGKSVRSFKIWLQDGYVTYSSRPSLAGKTFEVTSNLASAWEGNLFAEFDQLEHVEDALEQDSGLPLLEIYSPVRSVESGEVLAVSEFYSVAEELNSDLLYAKLQSWLLFASAGIGMFLTLSTIVFRGSQTIELQQQKLEERVQDLSELRRRVENASRKTTEINERYLRRIGSDLHDGPSQLIALALLKMDSLKHQTTRMEGASQDNDIDITRDALNEALNEIRNVSAGLAMPEIEGLSVDQTVGKVVKAHELRTGSSVSLIASRCKEQIPHSILICLYRFVQEALNNAFYHGQADVVSVLPTFADNTLQVSVIDDGRGFDIADINSQSTGFGLPGLRERIESVGGFFDIDSRLGRGTEVKARFVFTPPEHHIISAEAS
ncbi:MAG: sensor histidine kinase [Granulosicoccus sp.]